MPVFPPLPSGEIGNDWRIGAELNPRHTSSPVLRRHLLAEAARSHCHLRSKEKLSLLSHYYKTVSNKNELLGVFSLVIKANGGQILDCVTFFLYRQCVILYK